MTPPFTRYPRWLHRLYALVCGYFWLPCPLCGREFGGHEWGDRLQTIRSPRGQGFGRGVCPWCIGSRATLEYEALRFDGVTFDWSVVPSVVVGGATTPKGNE